jgi:hypothetical protein
LGFLGVYLLVLASIAALHKIADEDMPLSSYHLMLMTAVIFPLLMVLPAMAWWTLKTRRPSARRWALAASITNLLILVAGLDGLRHLGRMRTFPVYALSGFLGLLGIVSFWRDDDPAPGRKREHELVLRLLTCRHYLRADELSKAIANLREAEALYDGCVFEKPQDICAEFAFVNAFYKRDLAAAELWSSRMEEIGSEPDADYWRARTALLWLRGEKDQAREAWENGNALAAQLPAAGSHDFTRSCFAKLRAAFDAPIPADS